MEKENLVNLGLDATEATIETFSKSKTVQLVSFIYTQSLNHQFKLKLNPAFLVNFEKIGNTIGKVGYAIDGGSLFFDLVKNGVDPIEALVVTDVSIFSAYKIQESISKSSIFKVTGKKFIDSFLKIVQSSSVAASVLDAPRNFFELCKNQDYSLMDSVIGAGTGLLSQGGFSLLLFRLSMLPLPLQVKIPLTILNCVASGKIGEWVSEHAAEFVAHLPEQYTAFKNQISKLGDKSETLTKNAKQFAARQIHIYKTQNVKDPHQQANIFFKITDDMAKDILSKKLSVQEQNLYFVLLTEQLSNYFFIKPNEGLKLITSSKKPLSKPTFNQGENKMTSEQFLQQYGLKQQQFNVEMNQKLDDILVGMNQQSDQQFFQEKIQRAQVFFHNLSSIKSKELQAIGAVGNELMKVHVALNQLNKDIPVLNSMVSKISMISPYATLAVAAVSIFRMFRGRKKKGNELAPLMHAIQALSQQMQENFQQVFKNQKYIFDAVMDLTRFTTIHMNAALEKLDDLALDFQQLRNIVKEGFQQQFLKDFEDALYSIKRYKEQVGVSISHDKYEQSLLEVQRWIEEKSYGSFFTGEIELKSQKSFQQVSEFLRAEEKNHYANALFFLAHQFGPLPEAINMKKLFNAGIWAKAVQTYLAEINEFGGNVQPIIKEIISSGHNVLKFVEFIRQNQNIIEKLTKQYDLVLRSIHQAIDRIRANKYNQILQGKEKKPDVAHWKLYEFLNSGEKQLLDHLLQKLDAYYYLIKAWHYFSGKPSALTLKNSEEMLQVEYPSSISSANQELIDATQNLDLPRAKTALMMGADINCYGIGPAGGSGQGPLNAPIIMLTIRSKALSYKLSPSILIDYFNFVINYPGVKLDQYNIGVWYGSEFVALGHLVWQERSDLALLLLAKGANQNLYCQKYCAPATPYGDACRRTQTVGTVEIVKTFNYFNSITKEDWQIAYQFHQAVVNDDQKLINELKEKNINLECLLWLVSILGHWQVFDVLGKQPIAVNLKITDALTPLVFAVKDNHPDVVRHLMKLGADPKIKDRNGLSMLHLACKEGFKEVVEELLQLNDVADKKLVIQQILDQNNQPEEVTQFLKSLLEIKIVSEPVTITLIEHAVISTLAEVFEKESLLGCNITNFEQKENDSYQFQVDKGFLATPLLKAALPNTNTLEELEEHDVKPNGDCGFIALGTDRNILSQKLLLLKNNISDRTFLAEEIRNAFITYSVTDGEEGLQPNDPTVWKQMQDERDAAQKNLDQLFQKIRNSLSDESTKRLPLIELVGWLNRNRRTNEAQALLTHELAVSQAENKIQNYCKTPIVFEYYIKALGNTSAEKPLWIGYKSALLYAKQANLALYIWKKDYHSTDQLTLVDYYSGTGSTIQAIHMLHTHGFTHFNLLSKPSIQLENKVILNESPEVKQAQKKSPTFFIQESKKVIISDKKQEDNLEEKVYYLYQEAKKLSGIEALNKFKEAEKILNQIYSGSPFQENLLLKIKFHIRLYNSNDLKEIYKLYSNQSYRFAKSKLKSTKELQQHQEEAEWFMRKIERKMQ